MASFTQQTDANCYQLNIGKGEDKYIMSEYLYAVFDGHGGKMVSNELAKELVNFMPDLNQFYKFNNNNEITNAIINAFKRADEHVIQLIENNKNCGSTCAMVIKLDTKIIMVNLGDSDVILFVNGQKQIEMPKHIYSNPDEKDRIDKLKELKQIYIKPGYCPKVLSSEDITMMISNYIGIRSSDEELVPTKSFGHTNWKKKNLMDVHPNISIVDIEERNTYECVIFSDGVSDMLVNNDELIPLIQGRNQAQNIVEFAKSRWEQEWNYKIKGYRETANQKINGIDDITAIYIRF